MKKVVLLTLCALVSLNSNVLAATMVPNPSSIEQHQLQASDVNVDSQEGEIVRIFKVENGQIIEMDISKYDSYLNPVEDSSRIQTRGAITYFKPSSNTVGYRSQYKKRACQSLYNTSGSNANLTFKCMTQFSSTANVTLSWNISSAISSSIGHSLSSSESVEFTIGALVRPGYSAWIEFTPNMRNVKGTYYDYNKDGMLISQQYIDSYFPLEINGQADGFYTVVEKYGRP